MNPLNAIICETRLAAARVQEAGKTIKKTSYVRCYSPEEYAVLASEISRFIADVETATTDLKRLCNELKAASNPTQKKQRGGPTMSCQSFTPDNNSSAYRLDSDSQEGFRLNRQHHVPRGAILNVRHDTNAIDGELTIWLIDGRKQIGTFSESEKTITPGNPRHPILDVSDGTFIGNVVGVFVDFGLKGCCA